MQNTKANDWILVVEDDPTFAKLVAQHILAAIPHVQVAHARSVQEAQILSSDLSVQLFLVDVCLPDGDGIDFLCDVMTVTPNARAIVFSSTVNKDILDRCGLLDVIQFLEKPFHPKRLLAIIEQHLGATSEGEFQASLAFLTPLDIAQVKCISKASCCLTFLTPENTGHIYIALGEIIHAESLELQGVDALNEILSWKNGRAKESALKEDCPRTIHGHWQGLLLEAARQRDEKEHLPSHSA